MFDLALNLGEGQWTGHTAHKILEATIQVVLADLSHGAASIPKSRQAAR